VAPPGGFVKHLFISYAHIDNLPLEADQQGWISRFHTALEAMLSMRLGCKAEIWRDVKLAGNDVFGNEILAQFPRTAVMISVLSPRYISSDWCTREVREFCDAALRSGGVIVQNKSRVIKVVKTPVETEDALPSVIRTTLGYPFYIVDEDQTPLELDPAYGPEMAQKYNVKVAKLAFEIAQTLKLLGPGAGSPKPAPHRPVIYLAECAYDLRPAREALETELRVLGYPTLPDTELPRDETNYANAVTGLLEQCSLSIHLVGSSPGVVPDGPGYKSVLAIQNDLAIERSKKAGLRRVIWLPQGVTSRNPDQQKFIESLQKDPAAQFGADLIAADLETFKTAVHAVLKRIEQPETPKTAPGASTTRLVYVVCDKRDREATLPFRKFLKGRNVDTKVPLFEGDAAAVRQAHQDLLAQCDAVLVFYGTADEAWKRSVEADLKKASAFRGAKPLLVHTALAAPSTTDKTDLIELEEPNLINALDGFSDPLMKPFLDALGMGERHD
jgi:hypothetical protein